MQIRILPFILLSALACAPARAQDADEDADLIVTAARIAQERDETGQAVSVLTREAIERRQGVQLAELLAAMPGLSITRNGGIGGTTGLFLRGADSDQVLVLIDGVRVNDPAAPAGAYDFGDLLAGPIERVEVLRGSSSVAWGSQAIGGVVAITTRRPGDQPAAEGMAEYGYADTLHARATVSLPLGPAGLAVTGTLLDSDGISQFRGGAEADAYRNRSLTARLDVPLGEVLSLDLRGSYIEGRLEIDGFPPPAFTFGDTDEHQRTGQWIGHAGLAADLGDFTSRLSASRYEVDRALRDPAGFVPETFDSEGLARRYEYQGGWAVAPGARLSFGYEHEDSQFVSTSFGVRDEAEANTDGAFLLAILEPLSALTLTAGLRHDDHSQFGGETTLGAGAALRLGGAVVLRANYGEGFKAPSLYQLYSADYGNPALRPTRSESWEAGLGVSLPDGLGELSASAFRRDSRDLIDFVSCFGSSDPRCASYTFGFYDNVQRARSEGFELEALLRPAERLTIEANYTRTNARNRTLGSPNSGNRLARRPAAEATALIDWTAPFGLGLGATIRLVGESYDDAGNSVPLQAYTLVDLRAAMPLGERLRLHARVENLLDEDYQPVAGYGTFPASAHVGLTLDLGG